MLVSQNIAYLSHCNSYLSLIIFLKKFWNNPYVFPGGTSGIGRGTVLFLSKLGCNVAFGGRNKAELDNVAAKCKETREDAQVIASFPVP